jgi:hypothetical protein
MQGGGDATRAGGAGESEGSDNDVQDKNLAEFLDRSRGLCGGGV